MPRLPKISGSNMIKFLESNGFDIKRVKGSHFFLENKSDNLRTTIPFHGKEVLRPGTLLGILKDISMSKDDFCIKLKKKK